MTLIMRGWSEKLWDWRKRLQTTHLTNNLYSEFVKKLQNSAVKNSNDKQVRKLAADMNSHSTNEEPWMANLCMKRCSTSLTLKEMHIQIPVSFCTPTWGLTRPVLVRKQRLWVTHKWKMVEPCWKTAWRTFVNLNIARGWFTQKSVHEASQQLYSWQPQTGKHPGVSQLMNGWFNKMCIAAPWDSTQK